VHGEHVSWPRGKAERLRLRVHTKPSRKIVTGGCVEHYGRKSVLDFTTAIRRRTNFPNRSEIRFLEKAEERRDKPLACSDMILRRPNDDIIDSY
jgi:hypothetical protein